MAKDKNKGKTADPKSPSGQKGKPPEAAAAKPKEDLIEKAWVKALGGILTNAQKLDVALSFKNGRPVDVRGTIQVNGARLPFHTEMSVPVVKKEK